MRCFSFSFVRAPRAPCPVPCSLCPRRRGRMDAGSGTTDVPISAPLSLPGSGRVINTRFPRCVSCARQPLPGCSRETERLVSASNDSQRHPRTPAGSLHCWGRSVQGVGAASCFSFFSFLFAKGLSPLLPFCFVLFVWWFVFCGCFPSGVNADRQSGVSSGCPPPSLPLFPFLSAEEG